MQVVARKIYTLLDTILSFCVVTRIALEACLPAPVRAGSGGGAAANKVDAASQAAAHKAMVLARRFQEATPDLVAVLASHEACRVAGSEHAKLLDVLNFNGFYSDVIAR
jgi:hypothetical protein